MVAAAVKIAVNMGLATLDAHLRAARVPAGIRSGTIRRPFPIVSGAVQETNLALGVEGQAPGIAVPAATADGLGVLAADDGDRAAVDRDRAAALTRVCAYTGVVQIVREWPAATWTPPVTVSSEPSQRIRFTSPKMESRPLNCRLSVTAYQPETIADWPA